MFKPRQELDNDTRCYQVALGLLARREHSRLELINKLRQKPFSDAVDLHVLCDQLETNNYLSNERFAEAFVRSRVSRGQGEIKISYELRQRGIEDALIRTSLCVANIDWLQLAKQQHEKRFGSNPPKDFKERARRSRFLANRGFSGALICLVLQSLSNL
ncbi:MAG: regulatory protein RecX [Cocleimonas sp.]|nr:regulatory protein RecX [Cocleimonas sp.]